MVYKNFWHYYYYDSEKYTFSLLDMMYQYNCLELPCRFHLYQALVVEKLIYVCIALMYIENSVEMKKNKDYLNLVMASIRFSSSLGADGSSATIF
jgi:hypothetical protein